MRVLRQFRKMGIVITMATALAVVAPTVAPAVSTTMVSAATVKLNKSEVTLLTGETVKLKVSGSSATIKWSSSDKTVATVNKKGKVTAVGSGEATITAKVGKKKLTCKVSVQAYKGTEYTTESGATMLLPENWVVYNNTASGFEIVTTAPSDESASFFYNKIVPYSETTDDFVTYMTANTTEELMEAYGEALINQLSGQQYDLTTQNYVSAYTTEDGVTCFYTYVEYLSEGEVAGQMIFYDIYDGSYIYEIAAHNFLDTDVNFADYALYMASNLGVVQ